MFYRSTQPYFVLPSSDVYTNPAHGSYVGSSRTYSHYNYFKRGPIAQAKRRRFELALQAYLPNYQGGTAIDMGCADGIFLPSLSKHFAKVVGIDVHSQMLETAGSLVRDSRLNNVELINSRGVDTDQVLQSVAALPADVAFLLETLEHIGTPGGGASVYEERVGFIRNLLGLLKPDGVIVISIPRMVGLPYVMKHLIQSTLRIPHEKVAAADVLRAGLRRDTAALEPHWTGGHVGFNDVKMSRLLNQHFSVDREWTTLISRFFVVKRLRKASTISVPSSRARALAGVAA